MKRKALLLILAAVTVGGGLWLLGESRRRGQDRRKREFAEQLVLRGRSQEAIALMAARHRWPAGSPQHRAWMRVAVQAFQQAGDAARLGRIYYQDSSLLEDHEEASLLAARALILRNDLDSFQRLRSQWRGREQWPHAWTILEADSLLRRGRRAQALALLTENRLESRWEASRQVRLALLHASQPEEAWRHLADAIREDPEQAVARLFRAQLLEAAGRIGEARLEYVAARLSQPHNAALCDQLAEFYRRQGAHRQMLDTWQNAEGDARGDFIQWKAAFWSRVALPASAPHDDPPAAGPLEGLVRLVRSLPAEQFWDERRLPDFPEAQEAVRRRPEVRWLRVLELLRTRDERAALELLRHESAAVAWEAPLRRSLMMTLNLRLFGELDADGELRGDSPVMDNEHPLLHQLDKLHAAGEQPADALRDVLVGPHGVSLTLMACGWLRAAVELQPAAAVSERAPDWAAYGMAQAHRLVAGPAAAAEYLSRQRPAPQLQLLQGELLMQQGDPRGVTLLRELSDDPGALGERANWLTVVALIERQQHEQAVEHLRARPKFAATRRGRELRARIALLRHNVELATEIYNELRNESTEAKVFLARSAYHAGRLAEAERLTCELLEEYPADQQLLHSLQQLRRQLAARHEQAREGSASDQPSGGRQPLAKEAAG